MDEGGLRVPLLLVQVSRVRQQRVALQIAWPVLAVKHLRPILTVQHPTPILAVQAPQDRACGTQWMG